MIMKNKINFETDENTNEQYILQLFIWMIQWGGEYINWNNTSIYYICTMFVK
jgi:hypothetical protein